MGSRMLHALPRLTCVHIFRIPLPSRSESVFEVNDHDDDTAYGAPGINDTYFGCIHEVDSEKVSGALKGSDLKSRRPSQGNDAIAYAEPLAQGTSTSISTMIEDDHVPGVFNLVHPPPGPFSTPPNAFSTAPAPDIPNDADMHLVECYHEVAHGASCHQCTTPMRRRCFERVTAAISAARSNFKYKRRAAPELEENLSLTTELFDEYTRELVVRFLPPCLSCFSDQYLHGPFYHPKLSYSLVVVSLLNNRHHTSVLKHTPNPVYPPKDATFDFPIYLSLADRIGSVELVVWDKDALKFKKEYVGEVALTLDAWFKDSDTHSLATRLPFTAEANKVGFYLFLLFIELAIHISL